MSLTRISRWINWTQLRRSGKSRNANQEIGAPGHPAENSSVQNTGTSRLEHRKRLC
jgi:hypothetical protein